MTNMTYIVSVKTKAIGCNQSEIFNDGKVIIKEEGQNIQLVFDDRRLPLTRYNVKQLERNEPVLVLPGQVTDNDLTIYCIYDATKEIRRRTL